MYSIVRAAQVVDGLGNAPMRDAEVHIADGRLAYVGFSAGAPAAPEAGEIREFPDGTLLPGLIDAHVHPTSIPEGLAGDPPDVVVALEALKPMRQLLAAGVTTARVPGSPGTTSQALRDAQRSGCFPGPRLLVAGNIICPTGGHGRGLGVEADGPVEVRKAVRRQFKNGVDFIKLTASGGGLTPGTLMGQPTFTVEEMRAAVEEAAQHASYVTAHVHASLAIERALDAGIRSFEHASFFNTSGECEFVPELADRMRDEGAIVCPTIAVNSRRLQAADAAGTAAGDHDLQRRRLHGRLDVLAELYRRGVHIIAGSDAPARGMRFDDFVHTLELHVMAGIPPLEAIAQATGRSAVAIGIANETGSLAPGLAADLLVVRGDPAADISALTEVRLVVQSGVTVRDEAAQGR